MTGHSPDYRRLERVLQVDGVLSEIGDLDILLEKVLLEARIATGADAGSVYTMEGETLYFRHAQNDTLVARGERVPYTRFTVPVNKNSMAGFVASTGEMLSIPEVSLIPPDSPYSFDNLYDRVTGYRTVSSLTLPLSNNRHRVVGVLQLINALDPDGNPVPFSSDLIPFARHFAVLAAIALERAMMTRTLLLRMINMAELRDPRETGPHVNRVGACALCLYDSWARLNSIPEAERATNRDVLRMAAMLHDVGKVGIADSILKKPGTLTRDERLIMESHCTIGAEILSKCETSFDEMAREIAIGHHENWDGSGYPAGVRWDGISLWARITAVADVFDALGSRRCYKDPWDLYRTVETMTPLFGKKFDPALKEPFLTTTASLWETRNAYPES
ncbi:MAG: HD domain-containing protein [Candidatus Fermentibacteraceae bacterium]